MGIKLKWRFNDSAQVTATNIYRSIIGFKTGNVFPFNLISGDTLVLKIDGKNEITVLFSDETTKNALIDEINSSLGGQATCYASNVDESLILRSNTREAPGSVEIMASSTALVKLGLSAGVITEQSESHLIGTVNTPDTVFEDLDGTVHDFYALATVNQFGDISQKTGMRQAISFGAPICVVEGKIVDLQGRRIPDVEVTVKIVDRPQTMDPHTTIIKDELSALSGEDGRFSIPVLQGAKVIFEVNRTRISDPVEIPMQDFVFFNNLPIYDDYRY